MGFNSALKGLKDCATRTGRYSIERGCIDLRVVYDNEKENWKILTNKEIYAVVKNTHYNRNNKVKQITLTLTLVDLQLDAQTFFFIYKIIH